MTKIELPQPFVIFAIFCLNLLICFSAFPPRENFPLHTTIFGEPVSVLSRLSGASSQDARKISRKDAKTLREEIPLTLTRTRSRTRPQGVEGGRAGVLLPGLG
jgi:hypothetical protein